MLSMDYKPRRPLSEAQRELADKLLSEVKNDKYRAVSFKMDNILVITPFSDISDLYFLMEGDYAELCGRDGSEFPALRTKAGEAALKKREIAARVDLKYIYSILAKMAEISEEQANELMARECALLEKYAFPRGFGKILFREAKNRKKRVVITAENVYPAQTIRNILENCGYGSYDGLVVISEIKNATGESYYAEALKTAGVSAGKLLHIGGDVAFDIELPIVKGSKALLMSPPFSLMAKSGRIRGYAVEKDLFSFDDRRYFVLRSVFGLYAAYGFDTPQNKQPLSDLCGDRYMMGFLILGPLSLMKNYQFSTNRQAEIVGAMEKVAEIAAGRDDFLDMFRAHFGDIENIFGTDGCQLPLEFAEKCLCAADRELLAGHLSADTMKKWSRSVKEPEIVPFSEKHSDKNAVSKLADKMFPPGTKVRNIVDGILTKGRGHSG